MVLAIPVKSVGVDLKVIKKLLGRVKKKLEVQKKIWYKNTELFNCWGGPKLITVRWGGAHHFSCPPPHFVLE